MTARPQVRTQGVRVTTTTRRVFIARMGSAGAVVAGVGLFSACSTVANSPARSGPRRIGYLTTADAPTDLTQSAPSLSQALRELGYVEGRDLVIEPRFAAGARERLPSLAAELVGLPVDVLVTTGGANSALAAKAATRTTPVVFYGFADPVGQGVVPSITRPGGNITGVAALGVEISAKRVEVLKQAAPNVSRIAVLFNAADIAQPPLLQAAMDAARVLGIAAAPVQLNAIDALDESLTLIAGYGPDGLVDCHGSQFYGRGFAGLPRLLDFAVEHHLPQSFNGPDFARAGGLIGIGSKPLTGWRQVARLVDRILKGADPGELPIEVTPADEFVVNLAMARRIGMTVPDPVLRQATEVVR